MSLLHSGIDSLLEELDVVPEHIIIGNGCIVFEDAKTKQQFILGIDMVADFDADEYLVPEGTFTEEQLAQLYQREYEQELRDEVSKEEHLYEQAMLRDLF